MNILVIGNGFDIAHGLPTSYRDFLRFISVDNNISEQLQENGLRLVESHSAECEIKSLSKENFWIEHFNLISNCGENWIDFEREISNMIQRVDAVRKLVGDMQNEIDGKTFVTIKNKYPDISEQFDIDGNYCNSEWMPSIKKKLLIDLKRLIRCLEIYICQYINNIDLSGKKIEMIKSLKVDFVLSFNYTNTFQRLYENLNSNIKYHYIHGKADISHTIDDCNMILGIDEYLEGDEKNSDNEFIEFKKFFQRIYKGTGADYKKWINRGNEIKEKMPSIRYDLDEIYILGHSLDVTDKDVLKELLLNQYTRIHIIYHDQKALADKIINLVKVIGQDKLIECTYTNKPKIEFVKQY